MEIDRYCSVCNSEAPMFCRMCSTHYCPDHLCLHLNVAWETNTWTRRNSSEQGYKAELEDECSGGGEVAESSVLDERVEIPNTAKSLLSYSEAELQAQYHFYTSQARRIRIELERRSLPSTGAEACKQRQYVPPKRAQLASQHRRKVLPKSATYHVELLLSRLRLGQISAGQIAAGIEIAQMRAAKKNS